MPTSAPDLDVRLIPLAKLDPNPGNVRTALGDLTELTQSIAAQGVLQDLVVAPSTTKRDRFVVIIGHRRQAAASQAGLAAVPCRVRADLDTDDKQILAMLVENDQRAALTAVEYGDGIQRLLEFPGYDVKSLAGPLGHTQTWVRSRLRIAKTPPRIRAGVAAGQITIEEAETFAAASEHPDLVKRLENAIGSSNWAFEVEHVRRAIANRKEIAATRRKLEKAKVSIYETRAALDEAFGVAWNELIGLQESAAEKVYQEKLEAIGDADDANAQRDQLASQWDDEFEGFLPAELTDAGHATCPGHAALLRGSEALLVCTQARLHDDVTGAEIGKDVDAQTAGVDTSLDGHDQAAGAPHTPTRVNESAAEREARLEREQLDADLDTAADVRLRHVKQRAKSPDADLVKALAIETAATNLATSRPAAERARHLLGLPQVLDEHYDGEKRAAQVATHLVDWDLDQLVTAAALPMALAVETQMQGQHWHAGMAPFVQRLTALWGHTWSDVERRMLRRDPALVEAAGLEPDAVAGDGDADL